MHRVLGSEVCNAQIAGGRSEYHTECCVGSVYHIGYMGEGRVSHRLLGLGVGIIQSAMGQECTAQRV